MLFLVQQFEQLEMFVHKSLGYIFGYLWVEGKYIYLENILKKFWDEIQKLSS